MFLCQTNKHVTNKNIPKSNDQIALMRYEKKTATRILSIKITINQTNIRPPVRLS